MARPTGSQQCSATRHPPDALGHKKRRIWAPLYLRGLMDPGERKSLQPMAARQGLSGHDQLQHFAASPAWGDGPLWRVLAERADLLVGGPGAALVIDDAALPKKGALSVGVARQCCGQPGKKANCQALVSPTLARREVPVPVALRLFPPDEWTADPARYARAGVPEAEVRPRSKGEIALAELDRLRAAGARFGIVLADAGYGASAEFRHGLDGRGLAWAVGIPRDQKVYGADVRLVPPGGRKRRPVPDREPREAEAVLAEAPWRCLTWRHGTKGALAARFAAARVRVGDGATWGNRDRDRLRHESLERLGWRLVRVRSTDWFRDPLAQAEKLSNAIWSAIDETTPDDKQRPRLVEIPDDESAPATEPTARNAAAARKPAAKPEASCATAPPIAEGPAPRAQSQPLADALRAFREEVIMREFPGSEPGRCILRDAMIDAIIKTGLDDRKDFLTKIPEYLRSRTDGRQIAFLERICEIAAEHRLLA